MHTQGQPRCTFGARLPASYLRRTSTPGPGHYSVSVTRDGSWAEAVERSGSGVAARPVGGPGGALVRQPSGAVAPAPRLRFVDSTHTRSGYILLAPVDNRAPSPQRYSPLSPMQLHKALSPKSFSLPFS